MAMKIGELADAAEVSVQTVRYYERRGLLPEPPRAASGYRQYDPETAARIRFIKRAQQLGFTLDEIEELLALRVNDPSACSAVESQASAKLEEVESRIRDLERLRAVLVRLVDACRARQRTAECPVLETLQVGGRFGDGPAAGAAGGSW